MAISISDLAKQSFQADNKEKLFFFTYADKVLTSYNVEAGSFGLVDTLCSDENLKFGAVEAKQLRVTFNNTTEEDLAISNQAIELSQYIEISKVDLSSYKGNLNETAISILLLEDGSYYVQHAESNVVKYYLSDNTLSKTYTCEHRVDSMHSVDGSIMFAHRYKDVITHLNKDTDVLTLVTLKDYEKDYYNLNQNNVYKQGDVLKHCCLFEEKEFERIKLGTYYCEKPIKHNNRKLEVEALDGIAKFEKGVHVWWNELVYPKTLREILLSLCVECGVEYDGKDFVNQNMSIAQQNALMDSLKARDVLAWIGQASGTFPRMDRDNKLTLHKVVRPTDLTVIPRVSAFKSNSLQIGEYEVQKIDRLQIRVSENDIGVIVGTGENTFVIQDNPLLYTMSDTALRPYAENILSQIQDLYYIPYEVTMRGLPYLESGDFFVLDTGKQELVCLMLEREFKGQFSFMETVRAKGNAVQEVVTEQHYDTRRLYGKVNELERSVEQSVSTLTDNVDGLQTQITQTAGEVTSVASKTELLERSTNPPNMLPNSDLSEDYDTFYYKHAFTVPSTQEHTFVYGKHTLNGEDVIKVTYNPKAHYLFRAEVTQDPNINTFPYSDSLFFRVHKYFERSVKVGDTLLFNRNIITGELNGVVSLYSGVGVVGGFGFACQTWASKTTLEQQTVFKSRTTLENTINPNFDGLTNIDTVYGINFKFESLEHAQTAENIVFYIKNQYLAKTTEDLSPYTYNNYASSPQVEHLRTQITQTANEVNIQAEQTKYLNMLTNSDFDYLKNDGEPSVWGKAWNPDFLQLSVVEDSDFTNGKALEVTRSSTDTTKYASVYQHLANVNEHLNKVYLTYDFKLVSKSEDYTGGIYPNIYVWYEDGTEGWIPYQDRLVWSEVAGATYYNMAGAGVLQRVGFVVTFDSSKKVSRLTIYPLRIEASPISFRLGRVFLTKDSPKPNINTWNDTQAHDLIAQINVSPSGVKIQGDKIDVTGLVTFANISDINGQTVIDGGKITASTIEASTISGATMNASTINAPTLNNVQKINGVNINATGDVTIVNWDGNLIKLYYNNGIVTGWTFEQQGSGAVTGALVPSNVDYFYFQNGLLVTAKLKNGTYLP